MVEKPPNALAVTTPFAERMEGCPPSPFPVDGFPPPATVLMVKPCPTQTPRKKRPQAVFVISIRHFTICGKMAEHHYREESFSSLLLARPFPVSAMYMFPAAPTALSSDNFAAPSMRE